MNAPFHLTQLCFLANGNQKFFYSSWKFKRAPKTWFSYLSYSETFLECINDRSFAFSFQHLKFLVGRKVLQRRESQLASGLVCSKTKYGFYAPAAKKPVVRTSLGSFVFSHFPWPLRHNNNLNNFSIGTTLTTATTTLFFLSFNGEKIIPSKSIESQSMMISLGKK